MLKQIEDIAKESAVVKKALSNIIGLSKPDLDIRSYLENLGTLNEKDNTKLEEYLSVFTAWQNYFAERLVIGESIKVVANSQREYAYAVAVDTATGTVNAKKDIAKSDIQYTKSGEVYEQAKMIVEATRVKFDACERGFRLCSRILTKRLKVTEL